MAEQPVVLITGAARRIGATCTRTLHNLGFRVIIHYRNSKDAAEQLAAECNEDIADSAAILQADLNNINEINLLAEAAVNCWGRLDALINNASSFYPTPIGTATEEQWTNLVDGNLKAPFFLSQAVTPALRASQGAIINIADIHADRPLKNHPIYCITKAGNVMLTKTLAKELGPHIRVNGIAPGAIMWPEDQNSLTHEAKQFILEKISLNRPGRPTDIADTIAFLLLKAPYITGHIISVDGGRSVNN